MIRTIVLGAALSWLAPQSVASTPVNPGPQSPQSCPPPVSLCDPGCYTLGNKITGQVAPPNYGLRLDGLFGNPSDHWTFDFEASGTGVEMCNDGLGTITVDGIAFGGLDIGGQWDANETSFVEIHFVWQNASCENGELLVLESNGGYGYGTVEWLNTGEVFTFNGKANGAGEVFLFDGANGHDARGWVQWGNGLSGDFAMTVTANDHCLPEPDCDGNGQSDLLQSDCNQNGVPDSCEPLPLCACPLPVERCDAGVYRLGDKVTGAVALPDYGLRLDGLFGGASDHYTFGYELPGTEVQLSYDGAGTITIDGLAYGGHDVGNYWDPNDQSFLEIHFVYRNVVCLNGNLVVDEAHGGYGYGTVTWLNTGAVTELTGKANNSGLIFIFDGATGRDARGWVLYNDGRSGDFSMTTAATNDCPPDPDCDGDGIPDVQEVDCNGNGIPDDCEVLPDCDENGIPDSCDIAAGAPDVNSNGIPDVCEPRVEVYCVPDPQTGDTASCPCGNDPLPGVIGGCLNASGLSATLLTSGSPSVLAADLVLEASGIPMNRPGVFFAGPQPEAGGLGTPFRNGLLCLTGPLVRMQKIRQSPGGLASYPGPGFPPLWQILGAQPGDTTYFQFWYRDPGGACLGGAANTTNALRVTWGE